MNDYKKQAIKDLSDELKNKGFRAFIAESGNYGFYTDKDGSRVISFQNDFSSISFSGNYKTDNPKQTGTGWRITESDTGNYSNIFKAYPPQWAVGDSKWSFTTLDQHLKTYQKSSKYQEK